MPASQATMLNARVEDAIITAVETYPDVDASILRDFASESDTPIEQLFAVAYLATLWDDVGLERMIKWRKSPEFGRFLADEYQTVEYNPFLVGRADFVCPQFQMEGWRVDFAILRFALAGNRTGTPLVRAPLVIVECDGHEFHERTAEQAERDRSRDRAFQAAGHVVFRFTGRELWRDPFACAEQVDSFLENWLFRK